MLLLDNILCQKMGSMNKGNIINLDKNLTKTKTYIEK